MKVKELTSLAAYWACIPLIVAQTTLDPSSCVKNSAVTAFPQCNYLFDTTDKCARPSVLSGAPYIVRMCNQPLFNTYFGCESEERLCSGSGVEDSSFLIGIADWHSICDKRITFTPTTPVVSSITASAHNDYCTTAFSSCASASHEIGLCTRSYGTTEVAVGNCLCQPPLWSLEYTCQYLGIVSCQQTSAALTNMQAYRNCRNAPAVLGPATQSATTTLSMSKSSSMDVSSGSSSVATSDSSSIMTSATSTLSITKPASSGISSSSSGLTPTQSSTGAMVVPSFLVGIASWGIMMVLFLVAV